MNGIVHWEIPTTDIEKARGFYERLFGWRFQAFSPTYLLFDVEGAVGGALTLVEEMPAPCIEAYVGVDDLEAMLARAEELGGTIATGKTEIGGDMGFWAAILDPCGCRLALWSRA